MELFQKCVAFLGLVVLPQLVGANGAAVSHSHNGRTHSHPLPSEGLSHSHGAGNVSPTRSDSQWSGIATTVGIGGYGGSDFYLKRDSLDVGKDSFRALGKRVDKITHDIELSYYVVSFQDCKNQVGVVNYYTIQGRFMGKVEFASGAGSVTSVIADIICEAGAKSL